MKSKSFWSGCILGGALSLTVGFGAAHAQGKPTIQAADPNRHGDGTMSPAAWAAMTRGPLPISNEEVAMKNAANRDALGEAASGQALRRSAPSAEAGELDAAQAPAIVDSHSFAGLPAGNLSPSDSTARSGHFPTSRRSMPAPGSTIATATPRSRPAR